LRTLLVDLVDPQSRDDALRRDGWAPGRARGAGAYVVRRPEPSDRRAKL